MPETQTLTKFQPGAIVSTSGVYTWMAEDEDGAVCRERSLLVRALLKRHLAGDWGDMSDDDKRANDDALVHGARLVSGYLVDDLPTDDAKLWIITEADRSVTTILFPSEY